MHQSQKLLGANPQTFGKPDWFHSHGSKMTVSFISPEAKELQLVSSASALQIRGVQLDKEFFWNVEWRVIQSKCEESRGNVLFTKKDLGIAFGLKKKNVEGPYRWLLTIYRGDRAHQGKYIGLSNYLNIPCPGTGHDGDPNISILIDDQMRLAVAQLIG